MGCSAHCKSPLHLSVVSHMPKISPRTLPDKKLQDIFFPSFLLLSGRGRIRVALTDDYVVIEGARQEEETFGNCGVERSQDGKGKKDVFMINLMLTWISSNNPQAFC